MWSSLLQSIIGPIVGPLVDRIPNPNERARAKEEVESALVSAFTQVSIQQGKVNEAEARHPSRFVAGWRPAVGWVCAAGLGYQFLAYPLSEWVLRLVAMATGTEIPAPPSLDVGVLVSLVMAMLGLGTQRTLEKFRGVARETNPN